MDISTVEDLYLASDTRIKMLMARLEFEWNLPLLQTLVGTEMGAMGDYERQFVDENTAMAVEEVLNA